MAESKLRLGVIDLLRPLKERGLGSLREGGILSLIETTLKPGSKKPVDSLMVRVAVNMICSSIWDKLDLKDRFMIADLTEKGGFSRFEGFEC